MAYGLLFVVICSNIVYIHVCVCLCVCLNLCMYTNVCVVCECVVWIFVCKKFVCIDKCMCVCIWHMSTNGWYTCKTNLAYIHALHSMSNTEHDIEEDVTRWLFQILINNVATNINWNIVLCFVFLSSDLQHVTCPLCISIMYVYAYAFVWECVLWMFFCNVYS